MYSNYLINFFFFYIYFIPTKHREDKKIFQLKEYRSKALELGFMKSTYGNKYLIFSSVFMIIGSF